MPIQLILKSALFFSYLNGRIIYQTKNHTSNMKKTIILMALIGFISTNSNGQNTIALKAKIAQKAETLEAKVVAWRRDFHQNPELGNREFKTAEKIANHLKSLGMEVQTGVGKTGVVGILKGAKSGPVVALRADMDGLPVKERADLSYASKAVG